MDIVPLKKKVIFSVISLFLQSGYSAFLGLIANLVLTILLTPKIFGIYFTVLSIISIFNYFSDIGLAASLVQKKEINNEDIKTTFTIQQLLIITIISLGYLATSFIVNFYQLPKEGVFLYWALLFSFFLSSLKTIPSIFLERKIQFQKIVFVQIVENSLFYITVIILALFHFSLTSFTIAVLLRSMVGVFLIYRISFWRPQIGISKDSLKKLLSFGVPFQASSFLALFKDDLITLYLGKVLGFEALGYIGWAKKWAESSLRVVMDNLTRVIFPVFSRIQEDKKRITKIIEKIIYYQSFIIIPVVFLMILTMEKIIFIIPKYSKWQPALIYFYLFSISSIFSSYSTPFINLLNALGKVKITFYFMFLWTVLTWLLVPLLTKIYGSIGFPITLLILSLSFILVIWQTKRFLKFFFLKNVYPFLFSSFFFTTFFLIIKTGNYLTDLFIIIFGSIIIYLLSLRIIFKINIFEDLKNLWVK